MARILKNYRFWFWLIAGFLLLFVTASGLLFRNYGRAKAVRDLLQNGRQVTAVIEKTADDAGETVLLYRYEENGITYTGDCGQKFSDPAAARAHIGESIQIKIDDKGNSAAVGIDPGVPWQLFWAIFFTALSVASVAAMTVFFLREKRSAKNIASAQRFVKEI